MDVDKETFVNAMMDEFKTNPEKIKAFALRFLDEKAAYNKGQRDVLDQIQPFVNAFNTPIEDDTAKDE